MHQKEDQDQPTMSALVSKKRVRFSVVEEFEYEIEEYTEEEMAILWYTMEEMVELCKYELELNQTESRKESHSWRGLEHMQSGVDERAERVQQICDSILDVYDDLCEQDYEEDDMATIDDKMAEALRASARALTREDRKRAYKNGLKDQAVAEALHKKKETSNNKRRKESKNSSSSKESGEGGSASSSKSSSTKDGRRKRVKSGKSSSSSASSSPSTEEGPEAAEETNPAPEGSGSGSSSNKKSGGSKSLMRKNKSTSSVAAPQQLRMNPIGVAA